MLKRLKLGTLKSIEIFYVPKQERLQMEGDIVEPAIIVSEERFLEKDNPEFFLFMNIVPKRPNNYSQMSETEQDTVDSKLIELYDYYIKASETEKEEIDSMYNKLIHAEKEKS